MITLPSSHAKFSEALAAQLYSCAEDFPIEFDLAWQWIGYTRKSDALKALKMEFVKGEDFCGSIRKTPNGGRPSQEIMLTIDCFKAFGMMAGTAQGKEIRRYFLACEKAYKASRPVSRNVGLELLLEGIARDHKSWECHFNPSWISEAERLTGWSWEWSCMAGFINKAVYSVLPLEVQDRLDEVNPVLECGKRARKQHQHFSPSIDERILKQLIAETLGLMKGSTSKQEFYRSHKNAYSKGIQLNLMIERGC